MLRIGEFARLARVSVKLLRHFHDAGVLVASATDRSTGYRYYAAQQLAALNRLLVYRSLGFSLHEIRRLMDTDTSTGELRDMLNARRSALAARIETERARLAGVEARIAQIESEGRTPRHEVTIRSTGAMRALSLRQPCASYDDVGELLRTIRSALPSRSAIQGCGAVWHRCIGTSSSIDCEALVFIEPNGSSISRGVDTIELPACTVASVLIDEQTDDAVSAYRAAIERATTLGYRICGPMREIYVGNRLGDASMIEVQFPVSLRPS